MCDSRYHYENGVVLVVNIGLMLWWYKDFCLSTNVFFYFVFSVIKFYILFAVVCPVVAFAFARLQILPVSSILVVMFVFLIILKAYRNRKLGRGHFFSSKRLVMSSETIHREIMMLLKTIENTTSIECSMTAYPSAKWVQAD